jgi:hypothetical protein
VGFPAITTALQRLEATEQAPGLFISKRDYKVSFDHHTVFGLRFSILHHGSCKQIRQVRERYLPSIARSLTQIVRCSQVRGGWGHNIFEYVMSIIP